MALATSSSLATRLFMIFTLFFVLFLVYGRFHFYRDPGSVFFDQSRAFERRYSAHRLAEIEKTYDTIQAGHLDHTEVPLAPVLSSHDAQLCVSMTTVRRQGLEKQYVEDAVLSMLDGMTPPERRRVHLSLLFTGLNATSHPSWHQGWLRSVMDDVWSYDSRGSDLPPETHFWLENATQATGVDTHLKSKATMDYTLALERCFRSTNAPYIAVFEGDVLMAPGWVAPTLNALSSASQLMKGEAKRWFGKTRSAQDWLDMRLFNQERSTGWSSRRIGGNNEFLIIAGINMALVFAALHLRKQFTRTQRYYDYPTWIVVCLYIVPVSVILFFQAGKASLLPPRPGVAIENFGCCSQALIFNRDYVPGLIDYLQEYAKKEISGDEGYLGYDMRTRDYASNVGLDRLALYPVQVQHMGIKSAMGTKKDEAQSIWSMAYESLRPAELKRRHDRAMDELFGAGWRQSDSGA